MVKRYDYWFIATERKIFSKYWLLVFFCVFRGFFCGKLRKSGKGAEMFFAENYGRAEKLGNPFDIFPLFRIRFRNDYFASPGWILNEKYYFCQCSKNLGKVNVTNLKGSVYRKVNIEKPIDFMKSKMEETINSLREADLGHSFLIRLRSWIKYQKVSAHFRLSASISAIKKEEPTFLLFCGPDET